MRRNRFRIITLMAVLFLLLAACGGGGSEAETETDAADGGTEVGAAPEPTAEATDPAADAAGGEQSFEGETLVVGGPQANIIETVRDSVAEAFAERTGGATIEWVAGGAPQNLQQLLASQGGTPPFDAVFLDNVEQARAIEADLLQELDYSQIPSVEQLPEEALPHEGYGPGWTLIRLGSCIRTDLYEENGIEPPDGVEGWFDPALAGRIALADSGNFFWLATMPAFADHFGVAYDDPQPLIDRFAEIDVHTLFTSSGDGQALLQSGEVLLAPLTDGRCINLQLGGEPVEFSPLNLDIEGETYEWVALVDTWDIPAGTEKTELAHIFIDVMLSADGILPLTTEFGYLPARTDVLEEAKALPELGEVLPEDFSFDTSYVPEYEEFFPHLDAWLDAWARAFRG